MRYENIGDCPNVWHKLITGLCSQTFAASDSTEERQCEHKAIDKCMTCGADLCKHCMVRIPDVAGVYGLCPQCAEDSDE